MKELKQIYNRISKQTQNRLDEYFNLFSLDNMYNIADLKFKKKINTYIEEWKDEGLLTGEFKDKAERIYSRSRVKNIELLELLIYGAYKEEQKKLQKKEIEIIKSTTDYYYKDMQKEVKKEKVISLTDVLFLEILSTIVPLGYTYNEYINDIVQYNAKQIYRQAVINIQQKKPLKMENEELKRIVNAQQNKRLSIKNNKIYGNMDIIAITLNNVAKAKAIYEIDKKAKIKFIAVKDEDTTKMCKSLDMQIFNVHGMNEFERYSKANDCVKKYKCFGLIPGLNLPPINDGFHWCRSTITYV